MSANRSLSRQLGPFYISKCHGFLIKWEGGLLTKRTVRQIRTCIINSEVPKSHDESTEACPFPLAEAQRTNPKRTRSNRSESG